MPSNISTNTKIDKSFKFISGVGYTTTNKSLFEETSSTGFITRSNSIFIQDSGVPIPAPGSTVGVVVLHTDFVMTADSTVSAGQSWLSGLENWIPPSFDLTYTVRIFLVNGGGTHLQEIFFTDSTGPLFDYKSGILTFDINPLPLQAGAVGIHITGYTYSGVTLDTMFDANGNIRIPFTDSVTNPGTALAVFGATNGFTITPPTGSTNTLTIAATSIQTAERINLTLGARAVFISSDTTSTFTAFEASATDSGTAIKMAREGATTFTLNVGVTPTSFAAAGKIRLGNANGLNASQAEINTASTTLNVLTYTGPIVLTPGTIATAALSTNNTSTYFGTTGTSTGFNRMFADGSFQNNNGVTTTSVGCTSVNAGSGTIQTTGTITTSGSLHGGAITGTTLATTTWISAGTGIASGGNIPSGNKIEAYGDLNCWSGQIFCQTGNIIANSGLIQASSNQIRAATQVVARYTNGSSGIRLNVENEQTFFSAPHSGVHVNTFAGIFFSGVNHFGSWGGGQNPCIQNSYVDLNAVFSARCFNYSGIFIVQIHDISPSSRDVDPYFAGGDFGTEFGALIEFHIKNAGGVGYTMNGYGIAH